MIKVFQFATEPPPYGGISVYVKRLNIYLNENNIYSTAFGVHQTNSKGCLSLVDSYKFPAHVRSYWGILALPRLLYLLKSYNIIHTHLSINTSLLIYLLHRLLRIPVVYTVHNQMIDREYESMNSLDRYFFNLLKNDSKVQFITVNEKSSLKLYEEFGTFKNPIKVIPAFVPPIEVGCAQDYISSDLITFVEANQPIILFYAESFAKYMSTEIYGVSSAIDLYVTLKTSMHNIRLICCIPNPDQKAVESYKAYLNDLGYGNDVYWQLGPLKEMWPLLKSCTVLFRPTCTDGDSIMIREALLYGLPVVTTDVVSRPDGCIVYPFGKQDVAINIIKEILSHPIRSKAIHFSYVKDILDIYSSMDKNYR